MDLNQAPTLLALSALTLLSATATADIVTLSASKDNTLYEEVAGTVSNGAGNHFFCGLNAGGEARRGVLAFDIAGSIPAGSTINSVSLQLNMSRTIAGSTDVDLHLLLADWGEGASAAGGTEGGGTTAVSGDATWIHTFYPSQFWGAVGGDFAATSSATTAVSGIGFYNWSSTTMVGDVQAWLDAPAINFGWIVVGSEPALADTTAKRFDSRTNPDTSVRPQLMIDFTPVGATGACCLPDGSCVDGVDAGSCATLGGTYQGDGTDCLTTNCPQPTGACCLPDGSCLSLNGMDCATMGGTFQGPGTDCGTTDCPVVLTPYVDALPIPGVAQPTTGVPGGVADYDIDITEFQQQLHRDLPPTTVWGYNGTFPGPTIETTSGLPITVNWINDLRDSMGNLRTEHILPVDLCMHGPNTEGSTARTVVHRHGGHVAAEFDGYPEDTFLPGEQDHYEYPNWQDPATLWYHDHALGITRPNVYMGLAGFYLVRDAFELALDLPTGEFEIPLVIQDRKFNADGSLEYPVDWTEHFFGDTVLVNGKVWPFLDVKQGKYRFRLLNGSGSRFYTLSLDNGLDFTLIGTDGGLLEQPGTFSELTLAPAERADVIVDFSGLPIGTEVFMTNSAAAPFPNGMAQNDVPEVMKFIVTNQVGHTDPVPVSLRPIVPLVEADAVSEREFVLQRETEACAGNRWLINGLRWDDITEYPELETTEVWSFINRSGISHPMHMHLVFFQVLDRQAFNVVMGQVVPFGPIMPPEPDEIGWKDTVKANPMEITRVIARFEDFTGKFAYHCHILEHEDHEMMRQYQIPLPEGSFCFGDGGDQMGCQDCPCNNNAPTGKIGGCLNTQNRSAFLYKSGVPSAGADSLRFQMTGGIANNFVLLTSGDAQAPANPANPCFAQNPGSGIRVIHFDGLRCVVQNFQRHGIRMTDAEGTAGITNEGWGSPDGPPAGLIAQGGFGAGQTRHFQTIYRDNSAAGCSTGLNTSQGVSVTFTP